MTQEQSNQLGKTLWGIADNLHRDMNAENYRFNPALFPAAITEEAGA